MIKNKLHEKKTLSDFIKETKNLTLQQKMNMSLDKIIEHKEIFDNDYYKNEIDELDKDLEEYFQKCKLDKDLEEYFIVKKNNSILTPPKLIRENYEEETKIKNNDVSIYDYWGVTKIPKNELLMLENENENENETTIKYIEDKKNTNTNINNNLELLVKHYKILMSLYEKQINEYKKKYKKNKIKNKKSKAKIKKLKKLKITNIRLKTKNLKLITKIINSETIKKEHLKKLGKKMFYKFIIDNNYNVR